MKFGKTSLKTLFKSWVAWTVKTGFEQVYTVETGFVYICTVETGFTYICTVKAVYICIARTGFVDINNVKTGFAYFCTVITGFEYYLSLVLMMMTLSWLEFDIPAFLLVYRERFNTLLIDRQFWTNQRKHLGFWAIICISTLSPGHWFGSRVEVNQAFLTWLFRVEVLCMFVHSKLARQPKIWTNFWTNFWTKFWTKFSQTSFPVNQVMNKVLTKHKNYLSSTSQYNISCLLTPGLQNP